MMFWGLLDVTFGGRVFGPNCGYLGIAFCPDEINFMVLIVRMVLLGQTFYFGPNGSHEIPMGSGIL